MTAKIINLADRRKVVDSEETVLLRSLTAMMQNGGRISFGRSSTSEDRCARIQRIADSYGIDIEAPFRTKPKAPPA